MTSKDSDFEAKWTEFEDQFCHVCDRIDQALESADQDAEIIYESINRFIEVGNQIDDQDEHARHMMAYNFLLADEVIQERMNVFSLVSLIEILDKNDKIAKAIKGHAKNHAAKEFVKAEWGKHSSEYDYNKSAFTRHYVRRVFNELGVTVTEKQMREVWLQDSPSASKTDGAPANGE